MTQRRYVMEGLELLTEAYGEEEGHRRHQHACGQLGWDAHGVEALELLVEAYGQEDGQRCYEEACDLIDRRYQLAQREAQRDAQREAQLREEAINRKIAETKQRRKAAGYYEMSPDAQAAWRAANEGRPAAEGKGSATSGKRGTLRWSEESGWAGTFGTSEYLRELTRAGVLGEIGTDAWATLTVLLSHANNDGQWKISYQTMAREMGMCERSVELHVAKLERDGVISKRLVPAGFGQWVNEYELQPLHEIQRTLEERGKRVRRGRKPRPPQSPW